MSEQEKAPGYMQELDRWTNAYVISPLLCTGDDGEPEEITEKTLDNIRFAIREKVLESYKNGRRAAVGQVRKEHYAQAKAR